MTTAKSLMFLFLAFVFFCFASCSIRKATTGKPVLPPIDNTPKDRDGDGITDADDKCPDVKGLASLAGCPDRDGDGISDADDRCPDVAGTSSYRGCPVADTDKDGINDEEDKCPTVTGLSRYQGCPIPDTDGDAVNDEEDRCPEEAGPGSNSGCPVANPVANIKKDSDGDGVPDSKDGCPFIKGKRVNNGCPTTVSWNPPSENNNDSQIPSNPGNATSPTLKDTAQETIVPNATVAYSYFKKIKYHETKDIRVLLKINTSSSMAELELNNKEDIEQESKPVSQSDTNEIRSLIMKGYKLVTVSLQYDTADFVLTPVNTDEKQELDSVNGNYWHWRVKAITEKQSSDIVILVRAEKPGGGAAQKDSRTIAVKVEIDNIGGLRKAWNWVINNPQYSVPTIFVPFIIFIFRRRKKKTNEKEETST